MRSPTRHAKPTPARCAAQVTALLVILGACSGCTRPGLSLSADPRQAPIFQSAAPAAGVNPPTAADTTYPYAGALAAMILSVGGLVVVVLGFRLVNQLATANRTNGTAPT